MFCILDGVKKNIVLKFEKTLKKLRKCKELMVKIDKVDTYFARPVQ